MAKYRIRFSKENNLKYLSHLEIIKTIERAIRRGRLTMAYSEGYHPHPKLSFGPALAVGISSMDEYFDLELVDHDEPERLAKELNGALPEGLRVLAVKKIETHHPVKSLNAILNRAAYTVELNVAAGAQAEIMSQLDQLKEASEIKIARNTKEGQKVVNIRPWLHNLSTKKINDNILAVYIVGEIGSGGHLRPEDIIHALPQPVEIVSIVRTGLWHEEQGRVLKPMDFCDGTGGV
ncbi:radical SAM-linked protein [Hydrogenispora ethanolica]|jgi:radical SAM-linked protein|uniref:Radical SAM-linked protein n=1 Tax=Hydrogenispora ethanolica TaxID=1082276 RepID=A0A4R1RE69_HYDET|nr:TIGR03936 family radical SAM-associated protein [Hydrogenispora ethanolica]TCL64204.1 radical SAM-linked protein [Hydrogenispora ethanolica]